MVRQQGYANFVSHSAFLHLSSGALDSDAGVQNRQDAQIDGQATGAMSWAFITALKKNPQQSYVQLLNSIRVELESKYTQKPQLSCSHPLSKCPCFPMQKHLGTGRETNASVPRYGLIVCYVGDEAGSGARRIRL